MFTTCSDREIQICNRALFKVGGKRIEDFDQSSPEARDCEELYPQLRDQVLEAFDWSFAKRRAVLTVASDAPAFGYSYQYSLPSECLRPLTVNASPLIKEPDWVIEGNMLLTDVDEVQLVYIVRTTDASRFTPSFVKALSLLLASHLAMSVAKNAKLANELEDKYIRYIEQDAMALNSANDNHTPYESNKYADARN